MDGNLHTEYDLDVRVKKMSVEHLLGTYWDPDPVGEKCRGCPHYNGAWSCPPGLPPTDEYLAGYDTCFLVAAKVIYTPETRKRAHNLEEANILREGGYEKVARELLLILLQMEKNVPDGVCMGAGHCILCRRCARLDGLPCRHPQQLRYSITGFGFMFADMLKDELGIEMKWCPDGLPEYDVDVAALFCKSQKK